MNDEFAVHCKRIKDKKLNMQKQKKKNLDDKVIKLLKRISPKLPKLLKMIEKIFKQFDSSQPLTSMQLAGNKFNEFINEIPKEKLILLFRFVRRYFFNSKVMKLKMKKSFDKMKRKVKRDLLKDNRSMAILELMEAADSKFASVSLIVPMKHSNLQEKLQAICYPIEDLQNAENSEGELRANKTYEASRRVCEFLYKPYIKTIWQLSYLKDGKLPLEKPQDFGVMHNAILARFPNSNFFEKDAMLFRNSPSHSLPKYNVENDSLTLVNEKNGTSLEIKVDDLLEKAYSMYELSTATISSVGFLYLLNKLSEWKLIEIISTSIPNIFSDNKEKHLLAEKELEQCFIRTVQTISKETFTLLQTI
jgi:hypothetical protein